MKNSEKIYNMNIQLFADDEESADDSEAGQGNVRDAGDYIEAIKEMKKNSVSKEEYDKLKDENKKLIQSLVNGESYQGDGAPEEKKDIDKMRRELFDKDHTNLEYITQSLALRDEIIEKGGPDPFLPIGSKIAPTPDDVTAANRVADGLKHCVEVADGDPSVFNRELQRISVDSYPINKKKK